MCGIISTSINDPAAIGPRTRHIVATDPRRIGVDAAKTEVADAPADETSIAPVEQECLAGGYFLT